jgi:flagellar biosynthetic protein FliP
MAHTSASSGRLPVAGTLHFLRHFGEMIVAMFVGMAVLGAFWGLVLAAIGTSSKELLDAAPAVVALGLMFDMTVPMVLWMRHRGHARAEIAEMAGAMGFVALVALVLLWTSAIEPIGICGIECALMVPATVIVMLHHRRAYVR